MKKSHYVLSHGKLFKIVKVKKKHIYVVPSSKRMSKTLAAKTYYKEHLESAGYKIGGEGVF